MPKNKFDFFTVEVEMRLLRNEDIFESDSDEDYDSDMENMEIPAKKKAELKKFAEDILKNRKDGMWLWLYWSEDMPKGYTHFLSSSCSFEKGIPVFTLILQYDLEEKITPKFLTEDVYGIFDHWKYSSSIAWKLEKFNILSKYDKYSRLFSGVHTKRRNSDDGSSWF